MWGKAGILTEENAECLTEDVNCDASMRRSPTESGKSPGMRLDLEVCSKSESADEPHLNEHPRLHGKNPTESII